MDPIRIALVLVAVGGAYIALSSAADSDPELRVGGVVIGGGLVVADLVLAWLVLH